MRDEDLQDESDGGDGTDYQPVVYARDDEQAEQLRDLLIDHDVPAMIQEDEYGDHLATAKGIPVVVPTAYLNEAGEVIEEYENMDGLVLDDESADQDEDEEEELDAVPLVPGDEEEEKEEEEEEDAQDPDVAEVELDDEGADIEEDDLDDDEEDLDADEEDS
jgi:hypothetical protein